MLWHHWVAAGGLYSSKNLAFPYLCVCVCVCVSCCGGGGGGGGGCLNPGISFRLGIHHSSGLPPFEARHAL